MRETLLKNEGSLHQGTTSISSTGSNQETIQIGSTKEQCSRRLKNLLLPSAGMI
jgi:hypothetical protein